MHKAVLQISYSGVRGGQERSLQVSSMLFSKQWGLMCVSIPVCTKYSTMTAGGKIVLDSYSNHSVHWSLVWGYFIFLSTLVLFFSLPFLSLQTMRVL